MSVDHAFKRLCEIGGRLDLVELCVGNQGLDAGLMFSSPVSARTRMDVATRGARPNGASHGMGGMFEAPRR